MNRKLRRKILKLKNIFDEEKIKNMAIKTNFIQRERKFNSLNFLKFCVFSDDGLCKDSLSKLCTALNKHEKISISTEGLNNKFTERSVEFLKEFLLDLLINQDDVAENTLSSIKNKFKKIRIMDSTHYSLPDEFKNRYAGNGGSASEAAAKIHLEYDLLTGTFLNLELTGGTRNDADYMLDVINTIEEGDLCIRDLGYFSTYAFEKIIKKKAYFISKIKSNTRLYSTNKNYLCYSTFSKNKEEPFLIDINKVLEPLAEGQTVELSDIQIGKTHKITVRLIVTKLSEKVKASRKEKRLNRVKKEKNKTSNSSLDGANVCITNIPGDILESEFIYRVYSLRWQIELIFKVWKSQFKIHMVNKVKIERFECFLYGKLISLVLGTMIINLADNRYNSSLKYGLSIFKSYNVIRTYLSNIRETIFLTNNKFICLIDMVLYDIFQNGKKSKKKSKLTSKQILNSLI